MTPPRPPAGSTPGTRRSTTGKRTLKANAAGRQVALDVVMAKGAKSFGKYENVMKVVDSSRPSDHNMVVSDLVTLGFDPHL